jgi:hypothetical protein
MPTTSHLRERGFLTQKGTPIINGQLTEKLIETALLSSKAAIIHCRGHQHDGRYISQANNEVDKLAREAALGLTIPILSLIGPSSYSFPFL